MIWQIWKKKTTTPSPAIPPSLASSFAHIEWPTDAYSSARFLLGMYVQKAPPFSLWRSPTSTLTPEAEPTAELCAQSFQLALWFWMIGRAHGSIAETMARDAFLLTAAEMDGENNFDGMLTWLLGMQDEAYEFYAKKKREATGEALKLPREYYLALHFFIGISDSPYHMAEGEVSAKDLAGLTECLMYASTTAQEVWGLMQVAFSTFDPSSFLKWKWSDSPGAYEMHLMRRHNNLLFRPERRIVTGQDVYEARVRDTNALAAAHKEVEEIKAEILDKDLPPNWNDYLHQMRERIDDLTDRIYHIGRNAAYLEKNIAVARKFIIDVWMGAVQTKPDVVALLEKAEKLHNERLAIVYGTEWLRQIGHHEKVIPPDEIIPSLLTEDVEALTESIRLIELQPDLQPMLLNVRTGALDIVRPVLAAGYSLPGIADKLAIIGVAI
jgi:hypothetical protein